MQLCTLDFHDRNYDKKGLQYSKWGQVTGFEISSVLDVMGTLYSAELTPWH